MKNVNKSSSRSSLKITKISQLITKNNFKKNMNAPEELITTYRLCGKTSRIFTLEKKKWGHSEVTGEAAGRLAAAENVAERAGPRHVRAATGTHSPSLLTRERDATTLFSIYYICWFLLFFRISIFYFLVDAPRNSPVVLDPIGMAPIMRSTAPDTFFNMLWLFLRLYLCLGVNKNCSIPFLLFSLVTARFTVFINLPQNNIILVLQENQAFYLTQSK